MAMDEKLFSLHEEKEGWSDADDEISEDHESSLSFGKSSNIVFILLKQYTHYGWEYCYHISVHYFYIVLYVVLHEIEPVEDLGSG